MKKIFTLMAMMLALVGTAKAADVTLFSADFTKSPWAGHVFTHQEEFNGIYCYSNSDKNNCGSISADGVMSYMNGGNINSNRYYAIKLSNVNGSINVKFTMNGSKSIKYVIGEESDYNGSTANNAIELKNSSEYTVNYSMTGNGTNAILYFGRQGSGTTSGLMGIEITTPDASTVITKELTAVTLNGEAISATDLSKLKTNKTLTVSDEFDGLPQVKYTVTTTTNGVPANDDYAVELEEQTDGTYAGTFTYEGEDYTIIFTGIIIENVLVVTENQTQVLLTKANIQSKLYLDVTTNNWNNGKTYAGISGDFYNMSSADRKLTIKVKGAVAVEAFVQNTNSGRSYYINDQIIDHPATGVAGSGIIPIESGETTVTLGGNGASVYPVYVVFYTEMPVTGVAYTIPAGGLGTLVSDKDLDFSNVEGVNVYIATGLNAQKNCVAVKKVQGAIQAGTAILVEGTPGEITIAEATADTYADVSGNKLVGSATESINLDGVACFVVGASDGKFHPCSGGTLAAGTAYLDVDPEEMSADAKLAIEEIVEGGATAISSVSSVNNDNAIYNLQGVRVEKARKGIYIVNGKKVIY